MQECTGVCPQCQGVFIWGDGYHDLYDVRLCSYPCREAWRLSKLHRGIVEVPTSQMAEKGGRQQMEDGSRNSVQLTDFPLRSKAEKQME